MPTVQMIISMDETGQVEVNGPIENKVVALGLLEVAKDAIIKFHDKSSDERRIVPAHGMRLMPGNH